MTKRRAGAGSIEELSSGRFRVRFRIGGKRRPMGIVDTREEAEGLLNALIVRSQQLPLHVPVGDSLAVFGAQFLDRREFAKHRNSDDDRNIWALDIANAFFADWPVSRIKRPDVVRWLDDLSKRKKKRGSGTLSVSSLKKSLNLLRCCFQDALEHGLVDANPARDVRVRKRDTDTGDRWTFLTPEEAAAFIAATPAKFRPAVKVALGVGLRSGEQWNLRIADVRTTGDAPQAVVRFGRRGLATKNGKPRVCPLFGVGLEGVKEQRELVKGTPNPRGLLFPNEAGHPRSEPPRVWKEWLAAAGITRNVRWHDLRHTFAATRRSAEGEERWDLTEIQQYLGHKEAKTTERYAHVGPNVLTRAAQRTQAALQRRQERTDDGPQLVQNRTQLMDNSQLQTPFLNRRSGVRMCPRFAQGSESPRGRQASLRSGQ